MKKLFVTLPLLLNVFLCKGQWTPINSTTTQTLNDVDFINPSYGVIVGNRGTILLTTNGGTNWTDINNSSIGGDIASVKVWNTDTIFVSNFDLNITTGAVFVTTDGGTNWNLIADEYALIHPIDIETNKPQGKIFASLAHLISKDFNSHNWDTLVSNISGITSLKRLEFNKSRFGQLSGNVSGSMTYTLRFFRTEDSGLHWYPNDPFSLLNADAHTSMSFANADTTFCFTNQYSPWSPSTINRLIRLENFHLNSPSPGDTVYSFNSTIVNHSMPDFMNDSRFENTHDGLALGNKGSVYRTLDGGVSWTVDYTDACNTCALNKMDFENGIGYAVGENGILIKYELVTSLKSNTNDNLMLNVYPNPNNGIFNINVREQGLVSMDIYNSIGDIVKHFEFEKSKTIDLSDCSSGLYYIKASMNDKLITVKSIIVQ